MRSFKKSGDMAADTSVAVETITTVGGQPPEVGVAHPEADAAAAAGGPAVPAKATPTAVAPRSVSFFVEGEVDQSDIKKPYLSCVQAVGPKSALFNPGTLVLGEIGIAPAPVSPKDPTAKVRVIIGHVRKTFVEWLKYDPSPGAPRPRIFNSAREVAESGLTLAWSGNVQPTAFPRVVCVALIRRPDSCLNDEQFVLLDGDHTYALGMLSFQRTGYAAAKSLITDVTMSLQGDPTKVFYDLQWSRELKGQNLVWCPKLTRVHDEKPSDNLRQRVLGSFGAGDDADFGDSV